MEWNPPSGPALPPAPGLPPGPLSDAEIAAYVGPNAGRYGDVFRRFTATGTGRFEFSWHWPAFFCGVWWYLYRKMYLWAAVDFGLSIVFGWTFFVPLLWAVARAVTGNYLYFLQAEQKIRESAARSAGGAADPAHLARLAQEGGVHRWVAWAAVVGILALMALSALFFRLLWDMVPALHPHWRPGEGTWM